MLTLIEFDRLLQAESSHFSLSCPDISLAVTHQSASSLTVKLVRSRGHRLGAIYSVDGIHDRYEECII